MAIKVENEVVLIKYPGKDVGHSMPYLFSIYGMSGRVTDVNGGLASVRWSSKYNVVYETKHLAICNSQDHKDIVELFNNTKKFWPRTEVVIRSNFRSIPGVVVASDWESASVLVEWCNSERLTYLSKDLVPFQASFDPNLAFAKYKKSKTVRISFKKTEVLEDDIPF